MNCFIITEKLRYIYNNHQATEGKPIFFKEVIFGSIEFLNLG